jgi:hypothetical protein
LAGQIRRRALVGAISIEQAIIETISTAGDGLPLAERKKFAVKLRGYGLTERRVHEITGLARDTFRKEIKKKSNKKSALQETSGSSE